MLPEHRIDLSRAKTDSEREAIEDVRRYGVHILHIFDPDGTVPDFSYTMGLWHTHRHPEVVISGLKGDMRQTLMNNLNFMIGNGRSFRDGESATDVIDGYRCYFQKLEEDKYPDYLGWDLWFYDDFAFEAVQMIWPDTQHVFPWQEKASEEFRASQEILTGRPLLIS